jgi:hypothetical protein
MNSKLVSLTTGRTIATPHVVCLVEIQKACAAEGYHVLEITAERLERLADAPCAPEVLEGLRAALGTAAALAVGYESVPDDATWTVSGTVCDRLGAPIAGARVLAYDKDAIKQHDLLGCAFTDADGKFSIGYRDEDFKSRRAVVDFEGNPDVYLELTDIGTGATKRTAPKGEAKRDERFELKVDFGSTTSMLRPIAGYYFIEEDALEDEVDDLEEVIRADPDDAQAHLQLGLCFIELMKADLRQSEWMFPETRNEDDLLVAAALYELDTFAALDPARAGEAERYRRFVEELQSLAL